MVECRNGIPLRRRGCSLQAWAAADAAAARQRRKLPASERGAHTPAQRTVRGACAAVWRGNAAGAQAPYRRRAALLKVAGGVRTR